MESSRKRVLLVLPEVFGAAGGIQMYCRALCLAVGKWATQSDALVDALVLNDSGGVDARYVNGGFRSFSAAGKKRLLLVTAYLKKVAVNPPDLVVFGHISLARLAALPTMRLKKYCILTYGIEVWRPLASAERKAVQRADAVVSISDYTTDQILKRNAIPSERIRLIPPALDPYWQADDCPPEPPARPVLLTVTRMKKDEGYKGVDSVIQSLPEVIAAIGPVDYRIVGRGDDVPRLKKLAADLGVDQHVQFAGELSDEALREQYRNCSAFVMPSEREGFGIVFLEAMAHAKPVIGGAHGGTPSVVEDGVTGLLVERADVKGIAAAIVRLLRDDGLRQQLGVAGYERLSRVFTYPRFEGDFHRLLNALT
jgi:glycosyltransferase involved in cell wall biosynthesis